MERHRIGVREFYDRIAPVYDALYQSPEDVAENASIRALLAPAVTGRTLDIGCGTGFLLDLLDLGPNRYVGVDVSRNMLRVARAKHPDHTFLQADACTLAELPDSSFDAVVSLFGCLSYLEEPDRLVAEAHRLLVPGGRLFLMAYASARKRWRHGTHGAVEPECDYVTFTEAEVGSLVDSGRFVCDVYGFSSESIRGRRAPADEALYVIADGRRSV